MIAIVRWERISGMPANRLNGSQARGARAMLDWSVRELAERSGVSESSIRRIESTVDAPENVSLDILVKLQEFYEGRGFLFVWDDHNGTGVFWKRKTRRRGPSDRRGSSGGGDIEAAAHDDFFGGMPALGRSGLMNGFWRSVLVR